MSAAEIAEHQASRREKAARFRASPELYKICDTCWSVALNSEPVCRICGAYRWDTDTQRIRQVAEMIADSPFPLTAGTVPRFY
jgi:hypothetical protein